ncbi:MAG: penicillin-binding transpeptidase domain-containing protein [Bdellovibrionia bacterium]
MMKSRALYFTALSIFFCFISSDKSIRAQASIDPSINPVSAVSFLKSDSPKKYPISKEQVAEILVDSASLSNFPTHLELDIQGQGKVASRVQYSFDPKLQRAMEALLESYSPDYGAFVALDAATGRVLSLVSYSRSGKIKENLALRSSFPSASVFKVVTAAAAIEKHQVSGDTVIPFNGRNHTLYRGQILKSNITRWTRFITLKEAFARSINTVFGKIGAYTVGPIGLRLFADRFGFNRKIAGDLPIQEGRAFIPDDLWGCAESASGFTRENTMSPLQGALIAAAVANDGIMMEPYVVESISKEAEIPLESAAGDPLYLAEPKVATITMDPQTASVMRGLMKETVLHGTSRSAFKGFFRKDFSFLDVGGKTGSLTGLNPRGKYDWFVGYAHSGSHRIAVAALTISEKQWRVKSSYLARRAIESYFQDTFHKAIAER